MDEVDAVERVARVADVALVLLVPGVEVLEREDDVTPDLGVGGAEPGRLAAAGRADDDRLAVGGVDGERDARVEDGPPGELRERPRRTRMSPGGPRPQRISPAMSASGIA